jgi:hypothetical protein
MTHRPTGYLFVQMATSGSPASRPLGVCWWLALVLLTICVRELQHTGAAGASLVQLCQS